MRLVLTKMLEIRCAWMAPSVLISFIKWPLSHLEIRARSQGDLRVNYFIQRGRNSVISQESASFSKKMSRFWISTMISSPDAPGEHQAYPGCALVRKLLFPLTEERNSFFLLPAHVPRVSNFKAKPANDTWQHCTWTVALMKVNVGLLVAGAFWNFHLYSVPFGQKADFTLHSVLIVYLQIF